MVPHSSLGEIRAHVLREAAEGAGRGAGGGGGLECVVLYHLSWGTQHTVPMFPCQPIHAPSSARVVNCAEGRAQGMLSNEVVGVGSITT